MGRDIHHRSNPHCSSIRDTSRQRLPRRTASGCRSRPSRTTTGTGLDRDLTSSLADESTGTRRARISGAGCQGATPTTRYRRGFRPCGPAAPCPPRLIVACPTPWPRGAVLAESPTPRSGRPGSVTSSTGPDGCSSSSRALTIDKARFRLPTPP